MLELNEGALGWRRRIVTMPLVVVGVLAAMLATAGGAAAETATYSQVVTIPVAPASDFAGFGGGDGWDISLTPDAVYNVYHHNRETRVACHLQSDASACWAEAFKIVRDGDNNDFRTPNHSSTFLDNDAGKLYSYGVRTSDNVRGVVCADVALAVDATDLFCGFTRLADATSIGHSWSPTAAVDIGSRLYAFNYEEGVGVDGTDNTLMCFDTATGAACPTANIDVGLPVGATVDFSNVPLPGATSISAVGTRVYVPLPMSTGMFLGCFDTVSAATCAGAWPVELPDWYNHGAPIPLLGTAGAITGVCLPTTDEWCYDLPGGVAAAPPGLGVAIGTTGYQNAVFHVLDDRVYIARSEVGDPDFPFRNSVRCYDFGAQAECPNFPLPMEDAFIVYTVNPDPQRPACLWVNSDFGDAQIQNFDAFSGSACGEGPVRVLASSFVAPGAACVPASYESLTRSAPAPGDYTRTTVGFRDSNGRSSRRAGCRSSTTPVPSTSAVSH